METEAALVGSEGRVELDTISTVDLELALVVLPSDTELNHALGDGNDGESSLELGGDLEQLGAREGRLELCDRKISTIEALNIGKGMPCTYHDKPAGIRVHKRRWTW